MLGMWLTEPWLPNRRWLLSTVITDYWVQYEYWVLKIKTKLNKTGIRPYHQTNTKQAKQESVIRKQMNCLPGCHGCKIIILMLSDHGPPNEFFSCMCHCLDNAWPALCRTYFDSDESRILCLLHPCGCRFRSTKIRYYFSYSYLYIWMVGR